MNQKRSIENIKKYFNGRLVIKNNLKSLDITNGINWDFKSSNNEKTYQIYLHSLSIIKDINIVCKSHENKDYLKEARKIILDWYRSDCQSNEKWNEHAASTRIKNIIKFQELSHKYKIRKWKYNKIVKEHCEFLNNEKNYKKNNHGIMMDIALIYSSSVIKDNDIKKFYLEKALYRIRTAFYRDFSRKGVHLENSPEYHRLVLILYDDLNEALKRHKYEIDKDLKLIIKNAQKYNQTIIKPDLIYPLIGDTGLIYDKNMKKTYKDFIDYEAGIAIIHNEDKLKQKQSTYLTFKTGYQSKTHKHYDDLSITYFSDGHDILVDSGKYSYDKVDPIRKYLISTKAHNTIMIKDKKYILSEPQLDQHKLRILKFSSEKLFKHISGMNGLYTGISMSRDVILTNDNILFLVDGISSLTNENIQINFNLNHNSKIKKINRLKFKITIKNIDYILETFPLRNKEISSSVEEGYYSETFSKSVLNKTITFEVENKRMIFVTTLYRVDKVSISNIILKNRYLTYHKNGELVKIKI